MSITMTVTEYDITLFELTFDVAKGNIRKTITRFITLVNQELHIEINFDRLMTNAVDHFNDITIELS